MKLWMIQNTQLNLNNRMIRNCGAKKNIKLSLQYNKYSLNFTYEIYYTIL